MTSQHSGTLADLADAFRGVTVTIVTPFLEDGRGLHLAGMRHNVQSLAASGVSVIVPAGNTGEYHSLTPSEVRTIAELTNEETSGRTPVVVGVGSDLNTAVSLAQDAQRMGAAGILIHEPSHTFATSEGLYRYYHEIAGAIDIGVALYKRTPRLPDGVMLRVARECANVVGIKYAWNDVAAYVRLVGEAPSHVTCACGSAERWALPFSSAGTTGFTSGIANFAPHLPLEFWRALREKPSAARTMWEQLVRIEDLRAADGSAFNVPVVKYAMELTGFAAGPTRPPLSPLPDDVAAAIRCILDDWGLGPNPRER